MSTSMACDENGNRLLAGRYVARQMTPQEEAAFEDHLVSCADCQHEVEFVSAIIVELPLVAATPSATAAKRTWIGGGLALAAALAALMILRVRPQGELVALGAVREPPAYLGIPVRSDGAPEDSLFDIAMASYAARQYPAAAAELRTALAVGADSVSAQFFLGASLLLANRASEAANEFQHVLSHGKTPYRADARYYRAKALLRLDRRADAQAELAQLTPADGVVFDTGRALADSIARRNQR